MATPHTAGPAAMTALPAGRWRVDPQASELGFMARGMFGLAPARGTFGEFGGELAVDANGARGELRIAAATLDTGNAKRDVHLRSGDFFDAAAHPTVTFSLSDVRPATDGGLTLTGLLHIHETQLQLTAPLDATLDDSNRLRLQTTLSVDRAAAGVGWSKLGMIKGKAHLHADLVLTPES